MHADRILPGPERKESLLKNRVAALALISAFALSLPACSSLKTSLEYDKNADFGAYRTFAFAERSIQDPYWASRVEAAITAELKKKGISPRDENPDLVVSYDATLALGETTSKVYSSGVAYSSGAGWTTMGGAGLVTTRDLPVGTLLVDLADPKKKELVWRATGTHEINRNASLEGRERAVSGAIAKMFEGFPPRK
jgi:hypothetical protein